MHTPTRTLIARFARHRRPRAAPLRLLAGAPILALVVAACSGTADGYPTVTYTPPTSASMPPGMPMSPDPSSSAAPSATNHSGPTLHLSARNIAFGTDRLEAPAGRAFTLEFDNNDPGIPHNVDIKDATGKTLFRGRIITGPAMESYQIPALAAGTYRFVCDVHPEMTGTLAVQ